MTFIKNQAPEAPAPQVLTAPAEEFTETPEPAPVVKPVALQGNVVIDPVTGRAVTVRPYPVLSQGEIDNLFGAQATPEQKAIRQRLTAMHDGNMQTVLDTQKLFGSQASAEAQNIINRYERQLFLNARQTASLQQFASSQRAAQEKTDEQINLLLVKYSKNLNRR